MLVGEVRQAIAGMECIKNAARLIVRFGHMAVQTVTIPSFAEALSPNLSTCFSDVHSQVKMCMKIGANDDTGEWLVSQSHDFDLTTSVPTNRHSPLCHWKRVAFSFFCQRGTGWCADQRWFPKT